jgi:hypothetical protein
MPPPRLLPVTVALLIASAGCAVAAASQPDPAKSAPETVSVAKMPPIEFYLAKGEADACGPGCNSWIAAEGKIDAGAAQRLRRLLAKLGRPRPPIFLHSPGGAVVGGLELGRLIREQKLEASVAHTIASGCDRDKPDKSCEAQKRAGTALEAQIDPFLAMCNSACVYALAGGAVRHVPPWVKLAIHDVGFEAASAPSGAVAREAKQVIHERVREYLREMGIDDGLFRAASAIPFESKRFLAREEVVRFGIDRREFDETAWQVVDKPAPMLVKRYFARTDNDRVRYLDGLVSVSCGALQGFRLGLTREHAVADISAARAVSISVNGQRVDLRDRGLSQDFDLHSAALSGGALEAAGDNPTMGLSAADLARNDEAAGGLTLSMRGFSAAYAKLRQDCAASARNAANALPGNKDATGLFGQPGPIVDALSLGKLSLPSIKGGAGLKDAPAIAPAEQAVAPRPR